MVHGEINTSMQRHRRIIKKTLLNYIEIFELHSVKQNFWIDQTNRIEKKVSYSSVYFHENKLK